MLILRATDLSEAERLYVRYKTDNPPETRFLERFVHKAYAWRLKEAGQRDAVDAFYGEIECKDEDSVREDIEFSMMVGEAKQ